MPELSRAEALALDAADPLAPCRNLFHLPADRVYLDGNSLGALPRHTSERLRAVSEGQWGEDLVLGWEVHGWIDLPRRAGDKLAHVVGARQGEVLVCDSTSVNLFKTLAAALRLRPGRRVILCENRTFPTDLYMAQGLAELLGEAGEARPFELASLDDALGEDVAVVSLSHLDYRTGELHDMAEITRQTQARGALVVWDIAHTAGVVPLELSALGVDFAVGCGYKFLSGGPGAPAFVYAAERHQEAAWQPLSGWMGHAEPFAFESRYRPSDGVDRFACGTPPILSLVALDAALDLFAEVDMAAVRRKSISLGDLFISLVEGHCGGFGLELVSPRQGGRRGSQVSFRHPQAHAISQALREQGVIGDFRAPDLLRFGLAPLYLRHVDLWDAAEILRRVLAEELWDRPEYHRRGRVT